MFFLSRTLFGIFIILRFFWQKYWSSSKFVQFRSFRFYFVVPKYCFLTLVGKHIPVLLVVAKRIPVSCMLDAQGKQKHQFLRRKVENASFHMRTASFFNRFSINQQPW